MKVIPTVLAGLLLALLSAQPAGQGRPSGVDEAIRTTLASVKEPRGILRARDQLAQLGNAALEPLFAQLASGALSTPQSTAVLGALAALPRDGVLAFLGRVAREGRGERERIAALDLLARCGSRNELKLALELASSAEKDAVPSPELCAGLEAALSAICVREEGSLPRLASFFERATPSAQASIAAVLARSPNPNAAGLLAAQLGSSRGDADALLLLEISHHARYYGASEDLLLHERVRGYLAHPDGRLGMLACLAVEAQRDHQAVPDLVTLLDDSEAPMRQRARAALKGLTGLSLGAEAEPWMAWLSDSLAWWDERADPCRVALVSGPPADAAAAVRESAAQRLFLPDVVQLLELALHRSEIDVVRSACRALGSIPEPGALEALAFASQNPDPAVAAEVRDALEHQERVRQAAKRTKPVRSLPKRVKP